MKGFIFDVQRMSVSDGPGIRTVVFFKGCNMRCLWCHNPESQNAFAELQYFESKCIRCGMCVEVCRSQAHYFVKDAHIFRREKCLGCGKCAEICYAESMVMTGEYVSLVEMTKLILRDELYYENSNGGVTFSGGEPLLQAEFLYELMIKLKKHSIHCAIETAGNVAWSTFEKIAPLTDLFLYDLKTLDPKNHKKLTKASNDVIVENLEKLAALKSVIKVRMPIIPGCNDSVDDINKVKEFISSIGITAPLELLPYHSLGESKYASLGRKYYNKAECIVE